MPAPAPRLALHFFCLRNIKKILFCGIEGLHMVMVFLSAYLAISGCSLMSGFRSLKVKQRSIFVSNMNSTSHQPLASLNLKAQMDNSGPVMYNLASLCFTRYTVIWFCIVLCVRNLRDYFAVTRMWLDRWHLILACQIFVKISNFSYEIDAMINPILEIKNVAHSVEIQKSLRAEKQGLHLGKDCQWPSSDICIWNSNTTCCWI